jgi:hypothetical protein
MLLYTQLVRVGGIDVGILLSKAEEEDNYPSSTTHWVVSVQASNDEEIVSEKSLGRVLEVHESDDSIKSTIEKTANASKKLVTKKTTRVKGKVNNRGQTKRKITTRASGKGKEGAIAFDELDFVRKAPPPKPKKIQGDETVVEMKMNTGTLFIYRGKNHRCEFIRTI